MFLLVACRYLSRLMRHCFLEQLKMKVFILYRSTRVQSLSSKSLSRTLGFTPLILTQLISDVWKRTHISKLLCQGTLKKALIQKIDWCSTLRYSDTSFVTGSDVNRNFKMLIDCFLRHVKLSWGILWLEFRETGSCQSLERFSFLLFLHMVLLNTNYF